MKKLYTKLSFTALLLFLSASLVMAQNRSVSGKITDDAGMAIPGVNVLVKGTSAGTVSDGDGAYTLSGVSDNSILVFSFIGYVTTEVTVGSRTSVDITLESDLTSLEEVVVVGYGEQKKSLTTGAISSVKSDELVSISNGQIQQALQGRVAGVLVTPNSGSPGSATRVIIRGNGSNGDAGPLYIIDGVRMRGGGALDYINPNDIASMEVLKDAASAAIYGAEGANGVIIISTKQGKSGVSTVNYSGQWGSQSVRPDIMPVMNATQYIDYMEEANVGGRPTAGDIPANGGTDWMDVTFAPAPQQSHSIDFSGGTDKSSFFLGTSYFTQEGIVGGSKSSFDRYTLRANTSFQINDWLKIGENLTYSSMDRRGLAEDDEYGGVIQSAIQLDPLTPIRYTGALPPHMITAINNGYNPTKDADGLYYGTSNWVQGENGNPLTRFDIAKGKTNQRRLIGNVYMDITPFKGFKFTSRASLISDANQQHGWNPTYWFSNERLNTVANGNDNWSSYTTFLFENFASYNSNVGDHGYTVMVGQAIQQEEWNGVGGSYVGLFREQDKWSYANDVPDDTDRIYSYNGTRGLASFFGRVSYDYQGKYIFNATLRADGSSMLADGNQWGTFPSVSGGWIISRENFYGGLSNTVGYFKLRASWGQNGSLSNLNPGQWQNSISTNIAGNIQYADANGNYVFGAASNKIPNPELTWETSEQIDIGFDTKLLGDHLSFSFDYFKKTTKDLLAPGLAPAIAGIPLEIINAGTVVNKGLEFELNYTNKVGDFTYELGGNLSTLDNEVTGLNNGAQAPAGANISGNWTNATGFEVGQPAWYFKGYKTDGIFQNQAEVDAYLADGLTGYTPQPGDVRIIDSNEDGVISSADFVKIGNPNPKLMYGIRAKAGYKGFDLLVFLQGVAGNDVLMGYSRTDRALANKPEFFYTDRWTGEGSTNDWFRPTTTGFVYSSDKLVFNGSFARVRQLQLGYTLPQTILSKARVKNLRVYVSLDNFFTFTKYPGLDPEAGTGRNNSYGIDRGIYPIPRRVIGGVSLSF